MAPTLIRRNYLGHLAEEAFTKGVQGINSPGGSRAKPWDFDFDVAVARLSQQANGVAICVGAHETKSAQNAAPYCFWGVIQREKSRHGWRVNPSLNSASAQMQAFALL